MKKSTQSTNPTFRRIVGNWPPVPCAECGIPVGGRWQDTEEPEFTVCDNHFKWLEGVKVPGEVWAGEDAEEDEEEWEEF